MNSAAGQPLRVALLGCGVVGTEVARVLTTNGTELAQRVGAPLELIGIAVRDVDRRRPGVDPALLTIDAAALVKDADVVVELMGGLEPARELILAALESGASVVTANKALISTHGAELFEAAAAAERDISFEAAVAGAIPIIRPLRESLAGDEVRRVLGIVNGTTNFILDSMTTAGMEFADALAEAQRLGYAEADPTADVGGHDAAAKAAILASLAFHTRVGINDVYCEGISDITAASIRSAESMGCVVKLLAICESVDTADGPAISARVHPAMVPASHPLASVHGAFNAVFVESVNAGELMFYGQGAGGTPTASAVLGDIVGAARNRVSDVVGPGESRHGDRTVLDIGQATTRYHLAIDVADRAGVLEAIAHEFARFGVSIEAVRQTGHGDEAQLVIVTHEAPDADLRAVVDSVGTLEVVKQVSMVLRVEGAPA